MKPFAKPPARMTGQTGEDAAVRYLTENGYKIVARNYRFGKLETDIIATCDDVLAFVEVKTRTKTPEETAFGTPAGAVDRTKQQNLVRCARAYLREHPGNRRIVRMDVVEVYLRPTDGTLLEIQHFENAFGAY